MDRGGEGGLRTETRIDWEKEGVGDRDNNNGGEGGLGTETRIEGEKEQRQE